MQGRFELKYIVDGETKHRFLKAVEDNLIADPHGENAVYRVSSLYFDTPDFRAVWEKLDGESIRRKFRLRYYSIDNEDLDSTRACNAFMEIKHRVKDTVYKERVRLTDEGATIILSDGKELARLADYVADQNADQCLVEEIQRTACRQKLQSAAVITYLREAWMGKLESRLRLTFDSACQAYAPGGFAEVASNRGARMLDPSLSVMEVKFDHAIPCWIRDVLMEQQMRLQRFSKYASGILLDEDLKLHSQLAQVRNCELVEELQTATVAPGVSSELELGSSAAICPSPGVVDQTTVENETTSLLPPLTLIRRTDVSQSQP